VGIAPANFSFPANPAGDLASFVVSGAFTGTGQSPTAMVFGVFNVTVGGASGPDGNWNATVRLERSFDGGTTWYVATAPNGTRAVFSTNNQDQSLFVIEVERGVAYRLNCSTWASGTINYRMSGNLMAF
jgi:hypothetical protein